MALSSVFGQPPLHRPIQVVQVNYDGISGSVLTVARKVRSRALLGGKRSGTSVSLLMITRQLCRVEKRKKGRSVNDFDEPAPLLGIIRSYGKYPSARNEELFGFPTIT